MQDTDMPGNVDVAIHNVDLVRQYVQALNDANPDAMVGLLSEDVVLEMPFAPAPFTRKMVGRDQFAAFVRHIPEFLTDLTLSDVAIDSFASDGNELLMECRSQATMIATGTIYRNMLLVRISIRNGRISRYREFYDPILLQEALGDMTAGDPKE